MMSLARCAEDSDGGSGLFTVKKEYGWSTRNAHLERWFLHLGGCSHIKDSLCVSVSIKKRVCILSSNAGSSPATSGRWPVPPVSACSRDWPWGSCSTKNERSE